MLSILGSNTLGSLTSFGSPAGATGFNFAAPKPTTAPSFTGLGFTSPTTTASVPSFGATSPLASTATFAAPALSKA